MRNLKSKKILAGLFGLVIMFFTLLGTFECHNNISEVISAFKTTFVFHSRAILEVNDFIKSYSDAKNNRTKPNGVPTNTKEKNNKAISFLFLMLGSILVTNDKNLLINILKAIYNRFNPVQKDLNSTDNGIWPKLRFYLMQSLKFLTPVQKCILNRADEYDINPIMISVREIYPWKYNPRFS